MIEWADIADLYRYWGESPPVHELVAAWVGYKPPGKPARQVTVSEIQKFHDEMMAQFPEASRRAVA
jgi:hypothetical protein